MIAIGVDKKRPLRNAILLYLFVAFRVVVPKIAPKSVPITNNNNYNETARGKMAGLLTWKFELRLDA